MRKNCKTLIQEIKEDQNDLNESYFMYMDRKVQCCYDVPNLIYRFNGFPINIIASYFEGTNKLILKFLWKDKRTRVANTEGEHSQKTDTFWLKNLL